MEKHREVPSELLLSSVDFNTICKQLHTTPREIAQLLDDGPDSDNTRALLERLLVICQNSARQQEQPFTLGGSALKRARSISESTQTRVQAIAQIKHVVEIILNSTTDNERSSEQSETIT
jgi:hypothetical protein